LGKGPGTRCCDRPKHWEPERDSIRLRSVGCSQDKLTRRFAQEEKGCLCKGEGDLERLDGRQHHDCDQQDCRYLIDNTIEFLAMAIPV